MEKLLERFVRYAKINTMSDDASRSVPSTERQFELARILEKEMTELGLEDVELDENCYLYATLPGNVERDVPVIGFIAHMDTSPDFSAEKVNPKIVRNYDGKDLILNSGKNIVMHVKDFPELESYTGKTIITTDGNSLLGADDKAGIAEILSAAEYMINNPDVKRGKVRICFTPDEEIGRGADHFDVGKFGADFAYTMDGGRIGELEFENFNAAKAVVTFRGRNVHPGEAKNKMINAIEYAVSFAAMLPSAEKPEHTSGYEGFYHLTSFSGTVENAVLKYIIRDHDETRFEGRKETVRRICSFINEQAGTDVVSVEITDQYSNMRNVIEKSYHIVESAEKAMNSCAVRPLIKPIRGGTDGAKLSFMGLPCPNIFTGGHNYHGRYEYIVLESMEKAVEVITAICTLVAGK